MTDRAALNVVEFPNSGDSCGGDPVKRLDVLALYELAEQVARANSALGKDKSTPIDIYIPLITLHEQFLAFSQSQVAFPLSRECAAEAASEINASIATNYYLPGERRWREDLPSEMDTWVFWKLKQTIQRFEHVFATECRSSETYFMEKKVGFDVTTLLHRADENLHETIRPFVPSPALTELRDAGRCLALESYTASGFHTLRGLEVVMAAYYKAVSSTPKEFKSWFDYVEALEDLAKEVDGKKPKYPSPKVSAMLDRMRQLDRNPLMHPADSLDEVGADSLFKLGIVTITEIAKDMRDIAGQSELKLVVNEPAKAAEAG